MKFSIKNFFRKCDQVVNGKPHFLCRAKPDFEFEVDLKTKTNFDIYKRTEATIGGVL